MTATLLGIAITLSWENPVKVFADVTASRADFSARWPGTDQTAPKIQLTRGAQGSAPTVRGAPARGEIAAASEPANQSQTENHESPAEVLFRQFQFWAAKGDARAQVEPVLLYKMHKRRFWKMPQHLRSPCKSTERPSPLCLP